MKILITGGAGFIGSHLAEKLIEANYKVVVVDNFDSFYSENKKILNILESFKLTEKIEEIRKIETKKEKLNYLKNIVSNEKYKLYIEDICDMNNIEKIFIEERPEMVINLAALAGVRPSIQNPLRYEKVNIQGFLNILELCYKFNIDKLIQASSSSVYGNCEDDIYSEEARVDRPISHYAATKKAGEEIGYVYSHLYKINMIQLRFFTVYGERMRPDLAIYKFIENISAENEINLFGDGNTSRDYTYIGDILNGIIASIKYLEVNKNIFEVINLGSSREIKLIDMVRTIEKELNQKAKIKFVEKQAGDVEKTYADINKAKKLLNYEVKTEFSQGIRNMVKWYLKRKEVNI